MPYLLRIQFLGSRDELPKSRVLDVGEALERAFYPVRWAESDINDRRRLWNELIVTVHEDVKVAAAMAEIQKALVAHRLEDACRIHRKQLDAPRGRIGRGPASE